MGYGFILLKEKYPERFTWVNLPPDRIAPCVHRNTVKIPEHPPDVDLNNLMSAR